MHKRATGQVLYLVGTLQGLVDALHQGGDRVGRVQALVRVHLARGVGIGRHLEADNTP
jgi:hypothetical protein